MIKIHKKLLNTEESKTDIPNQYDDAALPAACPDIS